MSRKSWWSIQDQQLKELLEQVKNRDVSIDQAIEKIRHLPFEDLGFVRIDLNRQFPVACQIQTWEATY